MQAQGTMGTSYLTVDHFVHMVPSNIEEDTHQKQHIQHRFFRKEEEALQNHKEKCL